ncbi:MAG TPA: hypothetical protein ACFYEK_16100 [Candidatus Wunengus sp. YC60]|uniref:hypothetical protein n=1 Tax=Candidatus Wunengus sp. YC60 TaxID=3367697 RepID=UPI00402576D2
MFKLIINTFAEETLEKVSLKDKKTFYRLSRVGRWRILFTVKHQVINVWIVAIEKDTDKDYKRWIDYIISQ